MINLRLEQNKGFKWFSSGSVHIKGIGFIDNHQLTEIDFLKLFENIESETDFQKALNKINGIFSIIINNHDQAYVAVDKLRSFPILFQHKDSILSIADNYQALINQQSEINKSAANTMRSMGYVLGDKTLISTIHQLQAGEYLLFKSNTLKIKKFQDNPRIIYESVSREILKSRFKEIIFNVGTRLFNTTQNIPVALPLSGGFDSRLIGLLLKMNGHNNVLCFTYGKKDNPEAITSKEISNKLNFPWLFVDYKPYTKENYLCTSQFIKYTQFAGNAISFPYIQEYFAARYLKEDYGLPLETIFIPGHSGDMIGGSHLLPDMKLFQSKLDVSKKILRKNQPLNNIKGKNLSELRETLKNQVQPELYNYSHLTHDAWNISERQSKQIVNSSRVWDYFGYQYILPLWDDEIYNFFLSLPFEYRVFKNLYDEVLTDLFKEHNLLLPNENYKSLMNSKKRAFIKLKIKELAPFLIYFKKKRHLDYFHINQILKPMQEELKNKYTSPNGLTTDWYIQSLGIK